MNLTIPELKRIAVHHMNELYPELPSLCGKAQDYEDILFLNRDDDFNFVAYIAYLRDSIHDLNGAVISDPAFFRVENQEGVDHHSVEDSVEAVLNDEDGGQQFLIDLPSNCYQLLTLAELALERDDLQETSYFIGFVAACMLTLESFSEEYYWKASIRSVSTAWSYIPYIGSLFEDENYGISEDRLIEDAVFVLGLIHGSLWVSNTDFVFEELFGILEKIPTHQ